MDPITSYVDLGDPVYSEISKAVYKTYKNACIVWVEKNENKDLEAQYEKYKSQFDEPNVKRLFHGTLEKNIDSILWNGFDPNLKRVCAFGNGVYFSINASYSRHYSKTKHKDDLAYMLVCDVVCGKVAQGRGGLNIPPGYQSFTDSLKSSTMYIVDKKEAVYPRYIVAFHPYAK